jgi:glucose uptake protein
MIIPESYWAALLLLILSLVALGSWASTYKACGAKWRFELYYFDFVVGAMLTAVIAAFTLGQFGTELSFLDNIAVTGKRQLGFAVAAGLVFNLANMLLLAGVSLVGMATAFPGAVGVGLVVRALWGYLVDGKGSAAFLFGGIALILAAIAAAAVAHTAHANAVAQNLGKKRARGAVKGVVVSLISGFLLGCSAPVIDLARQGDIGLGSYAIAAFFTGGMFFSTFVFNIYFMNLPVQGKAVEFSSYFNGKGRQHLLGLFGGLLWSAGTIASLTALMAPKPVQVDAGLSMALVDGSALLAALWGLLVWKEYEGAAPGSLRLAILSLLLWGGGLALLVLAMTAQT